MKNLETGTGIEEKFELEFMIEFGLQPVILAEELIFRVHTELLPNGFNILVKGILVTENEDFSVQFLIFYKIPNLMETYSLGQANKLLPQKQIEGIIKGILNGTIDYLCTAETC